jgi:hypothetical protein
LVGKSLLEFQKWIPLFHIDVRYPAEKRRGKYIVSYFTASNTFLLKIDD